MSDNVRGNKKIPTLSSRRRQIEALKRKYARVIAAVVLKPVADKIVNL